MYITTHHGKTCCLFLRDTTPASPCTDPLMASKSTPGGVEHSDRKSNPKEAMTEIL